MGAFLITGNPGSGKTTMAAELARLGLAAVDTDQIAGWETASGDQVSQPVHAGDEWLLSHRWVWSRTRLADLIRTQTTAGQDIFLCGIAMNQRDMLDLFRMVFLLSLDHATQVERLNTATNANRSDALRAQILDGRPVFEQEMRSAGAVVLDGRQPTPVLVKRILREVALASGPEQ
jgi:adenylate kinase family enzyme